MSKKKERIKFDEKKTKQEEKYFRFGNFLTIAIISIWAIIVFNNYFKSQPIFFNFTNIPDIALFIKRIFQTIFETLDSILCAIGIFFIAFRIGQNLFSFFKIETNTFENFLFSSGIGFGIISYTTLFAGFLGLYYSIYFKIFFFILLIFSLWKFKPEFNFSFLNTYKFSINEIILITLFIFLLIFNFIITLTPENFYDALVYQLSVPNLYIINHKITPMDYLMHSNFPLNINMLYTFSLLINNEILARFIHFYLTLLSALTIFAIGKRFYNLTTGLIASIIYYSIPIVLVNSWGCGNDAGLSYFFAISILAFLIWLEKNDNPAFYLSAIFIGLTISSKYTTLTLLFVINIITFIHLIKNQIPNYEKIKKIFIYNFIAFLFILPYLVKNYLFTGNPVYPFLFKILGGENLYNYSGESITTIPIYSLNFNFINLVKSIWIQSISNAEPQNFIGPIFIIFLSFIFLLKSVKHTVFYLLLMFVISYPLYYISTPLFRFLMPAFIPLSIFVAFYIEKLKNNFFIISIFYINLFSNIILSLNIAYGLKLEPYLYKNSNKDEFLSITRINYPNPSYLVIKWINENLPENSKILFSGENKSFYLKRNYITYSVESNLQPLIEFIKMAKNGDELKNILEKEKITHILINYREAIRVNPSYKTFYWNKKDRKIFDEFWQKYIKLEYFKGGAYLYSFNGNTKKEVNILEELEKRGWEIKNLYKIFEENKMWNSLIDEYEDIAKFGYDVKTQLEILYKLTNKTPST